MAVRDSISAEQFRFTFHHTKGDDNGCIQLANIFFWRQRKRERADERLTFERALLSEVKVSVKQ